MALERQLTHKEIKMINDLLDGQLNPEKAKQAFLRIEHDTALKMAYDKLRWTKSLLRQAPRRKVPHNFTLTRQMAQEATGFYKLRRQTFSIAGALASFLFVVLLAVQLVPLGFHAAMSNEVAMMDDAMEAPQMEMMQAMPVEEEMIEEETLSMEAPVEEEAEEAAELNMMEEPSVEESVEEESDYEPEPTISPEEAAGGGVLAGEETVEEAVAAVDEGEADDGRFPEAVEEEAVMGTSAEEPMEEETMDSEEIMVKEILPEELNEESQTVQEKSTDWIFIATVLAGIFAFVFIFIALRDRNRA